MVYLDLDGFKPVNDQLGHDAGDAGLVELGEGLTDAVSGSDKVVRVGGDEFVVLVTDAATDLLAFTDRLDQVLSGESFTWKGLEVAVGVSVGVAEASLDQAAADELLAAADKAMLAAKVQRKADGLSRVWPDHSRRQED